MVHRHVSFELIFIEEVFFTEGAEGMHENDIARVVNIPPLHVFGIL
jgi:hypothetical protein